MGLIPVADVFGIFSALGQLLTAVEDLPNLIVTGAVDCINGVFSAISDALNLAIAALPSMPAIPDLPSGPYLGWFNWLYPVGDAIDILSAALTMYLAWMLVRYLFSLTHFGEM